MLCIMAVLGQKGQLRGDIAFFSGSDMCKACFAGILHLALGSLVVLVGRPAARSASWFGPEEQLRRYWWHIWLVLLVTLHLALFFLSLSSGPRCAASWPLWIRSTVMSVLGRFAGDSVPRRHLLRAQRLIPMVLAIMEICPCWWYDGAETVVFRSCSSIDDRRLPLRAARDSSPWSLLLQYVDWWSMPHFAGRFHARCCMTGAHGSDSAYLRGSGYGRPCDPAADVWLRHSSAADSVHRWSLSTFFFATVAGTRVAAMRGRMLQVCSIFRPLSFWTLRPRVAGRRDSDSRCSATPIRCMRRDVIWINTCHQHRVAPPHTHTTLPLPSPSPPPPPPEQRSTRLTTTPVCGPLFFVCVSSGQPRATANPAVRACPATGGSADCDSGLATRSCRLQMAHKQLLKRTEEGQGRG